MGLVQLTQIQRRVEETTLPHIDGTDLHRYRTEDRERIRKSRALAAFVVAKLTDLDAKTAAATVTDGPDDNGIDAIAVQPDQTRLVLVQSKWSESGQGSLGLDDAIRFREGVNELIQLNWRGFNQKITNRKEEIEDILLEPRVRIDLVVAHTGSAPVADDVRRRLDEYVEIQNDTEDTFRFTYLGQAELHKLLLDERQATRITIAAELTDWGYTEGKPRAYYGQVSALEIANWYAEHGEALFAKNVRVLLPDSEVNDSLVTTLTQRPEAFWYFNNGITVLCEEIAKAPVYGADRRVGSFQFSGASVVNGAQTVGSIARATHRQGLDLSKARVMVRFISLEDAPEAFAADVTRATNTQNRIGGRDFVSLDPQQARLRDEFALEDLRYVYRSGERDPEPADGCSVIEATVALACAQADPALSTQAKREISRLWDAIDRPPYIMLFNPTTTYLRVWRAVGVMRAVDTTLKQAAMQHDGRARGVAVHGNRLILHLVFSQLPLNRIDDPSYDWSTATADLAVRTSRVMDTVIRVVEESYPGYLASLFKNAAKCAELADIVKARLA